MAASRSPRARLLHIRDEIEGVAAAIEGLTFEQYRASYLHRRTVERAAQIVSEAAKALPGDLLAFPGHRSSESETSYDTNISGSMMPSFGRLQPYICRRSSRRSN